MTENSKQFPHVQLRLTREGTAKPSSGGGSNKINPTTESNKRDRWGHGSKLKSSLSSITNDWQSSIKEREEEEKPELPDARRIILQVDPKAFDPDKLKGYGIEVIGDLEDGYIIGASADLELTKLEKKIERFVQDQRGGGSVAEIWNLFEGYQNIFEVSEPDEFKVLIQNQNLSPYTKKYTSELQPPKSSAPKVCVIDSGIQERHPLLRVAIESQSSTCWIPEETSKTADYVSNGGHGTRVAGAILYPRNIPRTGQQQAICWLQNARVLDDKCKLKKQLFPPDLIKAIVNSYYTKYNTRIYNHSITGAVPCRMRYMSAWAATIDELTYHNDILLVVAAGNLPLNPDPQYKPLTRLSIREHLENNKSYPDYLLEDSCRIANPAQSFQALTVGSVASNYYNQPPLTSLAEKDQPSAFSCSGLGIFEAIKPEVVEYGGDVVTDNNNVPSLTTPDAVCPELVRSTLNGGYALASDVIGTSFAAPKVTHIVAHLAAEFPTESCLLYRALIVQSARLPEWTKQSDVSLFHAIRKIGYGIPNLERAIRNTPNRITLFTSGERRIKARQAHVYQVQLPPELISQGEDIEILVEITLSYKAQPRRTRRNRRRYLSTWLDWDCSKRGEDPDAFLNRVLKEYDASEDAEKGEKIFKWTLGKKKTNYGKVNGISRSAGTIQKDWTIVKSYDLREAFCIAVVGHEGWNNDPDASAPYSLVVSFEAVNVDVAVYSPMVEAQISLEVETEVKV